MKCIIAKSSNVVLAAAMLYYLKEMTTPTTRTPLFTFMSLWNDEEPYPIQEVITVLGERVRQMKASNDITGAYQTEQKGITIRNLETNLKHLKRYAKGLAKI